VAAASVGWETLDQFGIPRPACVITASIDEAMVFLLDPNSCTLQLCRPDLS